MYSSELDKLLSEEEEFICSVADWFIDNKCSISKLAENFGLSYGNTWNILHKKLRYIDDDRYVQVKNIIARHKRGRFS